MKAPPQSTLQKQTRVAKFLETVQTYYGAEVSRVLAARLAASPEPWEERVSELEAAVAQVHKGKIAQTQEALAGFMKAACNS
jgi:hypothetical protein